MDSVPSKDVSKETESKRSSKAVREKRRQWKGDTGQRGDKTMRTREHETVRQKGGRKKAQGKARQKGI